MAKAEQRSPFAPAPLQDLPRYYGLLRPCAPRRYSRPRGWSRLRLLPSRFRRDRAQVLTFRTKAWSSFATPKPLSTLLRRFACARLSQPCLPESCPGVSATLATTAFDRSGLRWLEIST